MSEIVKFNDREYTFNCGFYSYRSNVFNTGVNSTLAPISYNTLQELVINDSLFRTFLDAKLTIKTIDSGAESTPLLNFQFFSNNNNGVLLQIQPVELNGSTPLFLQQNTLEFYSVIEDQSVYGPNTGKNQLQHFTLQDTKEARLKETKVASVGINKADITKYAGDNISDIFKRVTGSSVVSAGVAHGNIEYTYPNHFNAFDAINFLIPYNMSMVNTLPVQNILKYDYTLNQLVSFPVVAPFLLADSLYANTETFVLGDDQSAQLSELNTGGSPAGPTPSIILPENRLNTVAYSNINFNIANNDLTPICVMSTSDYYNNIIMLYIDLQEQIKLFDNNIIKQKLAQLYGNDVRLNIDLDNNKLASNKNNYKIVDTNLPITLASDVLKSQLYSSFIFQNMYMTFTVLGQPYRKPGKFINIRPQLLENTGTAAERKLTGQWLVTEVKHIFTGDGKYTNVIQCVKPFVNK